MADGFPLAVSNIAWDAGDDEPVAAMLVHEGVRGVEIAPTKWRDQPTQASRADIARYRADWDARGLPIVALQSLLFGQPELQLFGSGTARVAMADYLRRIIDLGAALGAHALVFGSPKNRLRGDLPAGDATLVAADFFRDLGAHAADTGVVLCIEPVPARYGADFLTTPADAIEFVRLVDHPAIRLNADLGAMTFAGDDPAAVLEAAGPLVGHYHASELDFRELCEREAHMRGASGLRRIGYGGFVSVEMSRQPGEPNTDWIARAVRLARAAYVA